MQEDGRRNQKASEANQPMIDYPPDKDVVRTVNGADQNQIDDSQPSLSNRIGRLFRSAWERLSCCKKSTRVSPPPPKIEDKQVQVQQDQEQDPERRAR